MVCPQCGFDMGNKHKCMRCGYEVKTLAVMDDTENKENGHGEEETVTRVIDPADVYISNGDAYGDDFSDPFSALFGDIFDPIGSLLGGLFGFDVRSPFSAFDDEPRERIEERESDKKNKVVEVKKVEIFDENGNPIEQESKLKKTVNKIKNKVKNAFDGDKD